MTMTPEDRALWHGTDTLMTHEQFRRWKEFMLLEYPRTYRAWEEVLEAQEMGTLRRGHLRRRNWLDLSWLARRLGLRR